MAVPVSTEQISAYLRRTMGAGVELLQVRPLGIVPDEEDSHELKGFGYGRPLLLTYKVDGVERRSVLRSVNRNGFGRERSDDRVATVWLDYETFNDLPRHAPAEDKIGVTGEGELHSLSGLGDLALLTAYAPGYPYADDLIRVRDTGELLPADLERAAALARYLAEVHTVRHDDPLLWRRRLRDLIGHGEGIMGLTDSYFKGDGAHLAPEFAIAPDRLQQLEAAANTWRWKLKPLSDRLVQVHGDFHPFNILFHHAPEDSASGLLDFSVIDRSRGAWGEAADDVSCLSINYIFFALQRTGRMEGVFAELHGRFWETYLRLTGDEALLTAIQPWFAWRALVLASPQWYPTIRNETREALLVFAESVLATERYAWQAINSYAGLD